MKPRKILILLLSIYALIFFACEERVLDKEPQGSFSDKAVFRDIELTKKYAFDQYNALDGFGLAYGVNWGGGFMMLSSISDESYNKWDVVEKVNQGTLSPDDKGWIFNNTWRERYGYIRNINRFFEKIDQVENATEEEVNQLKGEMRYIRARIYFKLTNYYGGVPLIKETFDLDDEFEVPRSSYEDCIEFVVSELEQAANELPAQAPQFGRIHEAAAKAMKSRVLLYAASKLHNPGTEPSGELFDYDKENEWQAASDAAWDVINNYGYSLFQPEDWEAYQDMFLSNNSEWILARPYHSEFGGSAFKPDLMNTPNGYGGWAANTPTQNVVNDYEMANGKMIDEPGSGYDPDNMYENRDPRFYANILYNGAEFRGREVEGYLPDGEDSQDGPGGWNWSRTGYWMHKFLDESVDFTSTDPNTPRVLIRLAEVYLNYAEAQYHLGNEETAREYVNNIRSRIDMPKINTSGQELLEDIKHEREIELMFEGHRVWDLRRWMDAPEELSEPCRGIQWKIVDENGELDPDGTLTYELKDVASRYHWNDNKLYYFPIDRSEINKTNMQQNPGYN